MRFAGEGAFKSVVRYVQLDCGLPCFCAAKENSAPGAAHPTEDKQRDRVSAEEKDEGHGDQCHFSLLVLCYRCSVLAARNHGSQKDSQCTNDNGDKRRDSWTIVTRTELQLPVTTVMESNNGDPYPGRNLSLPQLLYAIQRKLRDATPGGRCV